MSKSDCNSMVFTDSDNGGIIHVANIKGGVGKSTVATNLAAALAKHGPTLVIDLDGQGSATHALGRDPVEFKVSSYQLFKNRYSINISDESKKLSFPKKIKKIVNSTESFLFPQIVGKNDIRSISVKIKPCLYLIPANSCLYKCNNFYQLQNLLFNLQLCRKFYKYIILDTPSVWNNLTQTLYKQSNLNLIPVTLNALSTKSLRDYLKDIKLLSQKNPNVRIRIIKNEVFGSRGSKIKGKTRTMRENRQFLESLCEQVVLDNDTGFSLLPQSVILDLEIPESATIRNAQDLGKTVHEYQQYSAVSKSFKELAKQIQHVLNNPVLNKTNRKFQMDVSSCHNLVKTLAALIILSFFVFNEPISSFSIPRPIAPQQLTIVEDKSFEHVFKNGESLLKMTKYAICRFQAVVPSFNQIKTYLIETVNIHNMTRMPGEPKINSNFRVSKGTVIKFYPPSKINNPNAHKLTPVYNYFTSTVNDPYPYITGDWCERGTGGGTPHYGIDVAASYGTELVSLIDGIAILKDSPAAGRQVGVVSDGMIIFYAHMNKRFINSGDKVKKGDVLGTIGMTGITSGPHVHIGYGLESPSPTGIVFGRTYYKLTDPKLFYYREQYLASKE